MRITVVYKDNSEKIFKKATMSFCKSNKNVMLINYDNDYNSMTEYIPILSIKTITEEEEGAGNYEVLL